jgi:hypothetical protein
MTSKVFYIVSLAFALFLIGCGEDEVALTELIP